MQTIDFKNKKVTVMGIGLHGGAVAMIQWLLAQGAQVIATDMKSPEELASSLAKLAGLENLEIVVGQHRKADFEQVDMVIKNPAVRWDNEYIQAALAKNIPVEMDSSLFFKLCPSKNTIGITGTKGKTTTASLIYEIIKAAGKKVVKVGIGQEPVMNKLAEIDDETQVVFELSSWRLSALGKANLSPHIAVVTNIYQDHLNYYGTMEDYIADKKYIFLAQSANDYVVLNGDNEGTKKLAAEANSQVMFFSRIPMEEITKEKLFSIVDEKKIIAQKPDGIYEMIDNISHKYNQKIEDICHTSSLELKGEHNVHNVMAAVAVGIILGISPDIIGSAVLHFQGNPHRLEFCREFNGVKYYNDTAATTPESAIAALTAFSQTINLICGGSNKNLDLNELAQKIAENAKVKRIFLLDGAATSGLQQLIIKNGGEKKIVAVYPSMKAAVETANNLAEEKEIVLLSPGCASFGMFQNEFDRGDQFRQAVQAL